MASRGRRIFVGAALVLAATAVAVPMLDADRYAGAIRAGLEKTLGRTVEVNGSVSLRLLPRPGFTVANVVIHDDPAFSAEPFAYVSNLRVDLAVLALARGRVEVAGIQLDEPSINVMRRPDGGWNFQPLLDRAVSGGASGRAALDGVEVSLGRLNFKNGDTKSIYYLADADLRIDSDPENIRRFGIRFDGEPARTDRARRFGRLSGRGMLELDSAGAPPTIALNLSAEQTPISEVATVLLGRDIGIGGLAVVQARLNGSLPSVEIEGQIQLADFERFGWMLPGSSDRRLAFRGLIDVPAREFQLETAPPQRGTLPVAVRVRGRSAGTNPAWAALITLRGLPLSSLASLGQDLGGFLPAGVALEGEVEGVIGFGAKSEPQGMLRATKGSLAWDGLKPIQWESADLVVSGRRLDIPPVTVTAGGRESVEIAIGAESRQGPLDLRLQSREIGLETMRGYLRRLGPDLPAPLTAFRRGDWRGALRATRREDGDWSWTGAGQLLDGEAAVPHIADHIKLASASVSLRANGFVLDSLSATAGGVPFSGSYSHDRRGPAKLHLRVPAMRAADWERWMSPVLADNTSLLARTLRRPPSVPDWIGNQRMEVAFEIGEFAWSESEVRKLVGTMSWNGPEIAFRGLKGEVAGGTLSGDVHVTLRGREPAYRGEFEIAGAAWNLGAVSAAVKMRAEGTGTRWLATLRGDGNFLARNVSFGPEADLRTAAGLFSFTGGSGIKIQVTGLEVEEADGSTLTGQGGGADGRLQVDLAAGERQLRLAGRVQGWKVELAAVR